MPKKTVTVEATEMFDADVKYVSLVKRGANRLPFRIIKSAEDETMIDLSRIFKREKPPAILAVIVNKGEVSEETLAVIKEAGFSTDSTEVHDGCTIFKQVSSYSNGVAVKLDKDVVVIVSPQDFKVPTAKAEEGWANEFYENMQEDGFYSTYSAATYYLTSTISKAMYCAKSVDEAKGAVSEILGAFTEYTMSMVSAIPAKAFKMSEGIMKTLQEAPAVETPTEATEKAEDEAPAGDTESTADSTVAKTEGEETAPEGTTETASTSVEASTETAPDMVSVAKTLESIAGVLSDLQAQVQGLNTSVSAIKEDYAALNTHLSEVEEVAKSATKVVLGGSTAEDTVPAVKSQPSETYEVFDTAFQPNVRKSMHRGNTSRRFSTV